MAQIAKPNASVVTLGSWVTNGFGTLVDAVTDGDSSTYVGPGSFGNNRIFFDLENTITAPGTTDDHIVHFSGQHGGFFGTVNMTIYLTENQSSTIQSSGITLTTTHQGYQFVITNAGNINNYDDLEISFYQNYSADQGQITECWLEVPDAGGGGGGGGTTADSVKLENAEFTFRGLTDIGG